MRRDRLPSRFVGLAGGRRCRPQLPAGGQPSITPTRQTTWHGIAPRGLPVGQAPRKPSLYDPGERANWLARALELYGIYAIWPPAADTFPPLKGPHLKGGRKVPVTHSKTAQLPGGPLRRRGRAAPTNGHWAAVINADFVRNPPLRAELGVRHIVNAGNTRKRGLGRRDTRGKTRRPPQG